METTAASIFGLCCHVSTFSSCRAASRTLSQKTWQGWIGMRRQMWGWAERDSDRGRGTVDPSACTGSSSSGSPVCGPLRCVSHQVTVQKWFVYPRLALCQAFCFGLTVMHCDPHTKRFAIRYYVKCMIKFSWKKIWYVTCDLIKKFVTFLQTLLTDFQMEIS